MLKFCAETHTYTLAGKVLPSVTQILKSGGLIDTTFFTEYARNKGAMLHKCLELFDLGTLDESSVDPEIKPYFEEYKKFKDQSGVTVQAIEKAVACKKYGYAGMMDRVYQFPSGALAIVDIKTNSAPAWCSIQVAAYQHAANLKYALRYSLAITKTGYKLKEYKDASDFQRFLQALEKHNRGVTC